METLQVNNINRRFAGLACAVVLARLWACQPASEPRQPTRERERQIRRIKSME